MYKLYRKVFVGLPLGAVLLKMISSSSSRPSKWVVFDANERARDRVLELLHVDLHLCEGEEAHEVLQDLEGLDMTQAAEAGDPVDLLNYTIHPIARDLICLSFKN
jgi:hypothetical protein